jgi:hypothetical protein
MVIATVICADCGLVHAAEFIVFERGTTGCLVCPACRCAYRIAAKEIKDAQDILTTILVHHGNPIQNRKGPNQCDTP